MHRPQQLHRLLTWLILLSTIGLGQSLEAAETAYIPPALLHECPLYTPLETAGTGLAPELQVAVTIDIRGNVADVEVKNIRPSSEYDELFESITNECISEWRYSPALRNGEPEETRLEWTVQFIAKLGTPKPSSDNQGFLAGAEAHNYAELLRMSKEQREQLLSRYVQVAEEQLDPQQRNRFDSPRFVVVSDSPEPKTAQIIASNLEAVFNTLEGIFGQDIPPQPEGYKVVVYVFAKEQSMVAVRQQFGENPWLQGLYLFPGLMILHTQLPEAEALQQLLIHETTHAYVDRILARPGTEIPIWLHEGFAEYMGNSKIRKGQLLPGKTLKGRFALNHFGGTYRLQTYQGMNLQNLKQSFRGGKGLTLKQLLEGGSTSFYGERHALYYPTAWIFVHFLRHGDPTWTDSLFPQLMLYLCEGYPAEPTLEEIYGMPLEQLEGEFLKYLNRF